MDRILVGVNDSPASTAAAVWAAGEAAMRNIELTIVHVLAASTKVCTHGAKTIDRVRDAVAMGNRPQPPQINSRLCLGPVVPTLWGFTQEGAQMIVLGQRSESETHRGRLGSVAVGMLQTARCPVAIVHDDPASRLQASRSPVVVGVDSSPTGELATAIAFDEAARRAAELVAVHAIRREGASADAHARGDAMHRDADNGLAHALADWQARYPDVTVRRLVTPGDPAQALLNHSRQAQLVVIGGSRHGSFRAKPFGGVSSVVGQACRTPLIVARRKPPGCQVEIIDDHRKIHGTGRFQ
jgi:nucleotide-binding universal stress UspA family protein